MRQTEHLYQIPEQPELRLSRNWDSVVWVSPDVQVNGREYLPEDADIQAFLFERFSKIGTLLFDLTERTYLDANCRPISISAETGFPESQPVFILEPSETGATVQPDQIGLINTLTDHPFPEVGSWIVQELWQQRELISTVATRHGIAEESIITAALIENNSRLTTPIQNELDSNLWQDLAAGGLNTLGSSAHLLLIAALSVALYSERSQTLSRRRFLAVAGVTTLSTALLALQRGPITPATISKYDFPQPVRDFLAGRSHKLARHLKDPGIATERSLGPAAIKPAELWQLLRDDRITLTDPYTGEAVTEDSLLAQLTELDPRLSGLAGPILELYFSYILSDTRWSLEISAARTEQALLAYEAYRHAFNTDWRLNLPPYEQLEFDDQISYLMWTASIMKGDPFSHLTPDGKVTNFGWKYAPGKKHVASIHPQGARPLLYGWEYLKKEYLERRQESDS